MYCPNCGSENNENEEICKYCKVSLKPNNTTEKVEVVNQNNNNVNNNDNEDLSFSQGYSIFLIIFSVLCCGGIIGAVFAILSLIEGNKIKDYLATGNIEMAREAKKNSKKWIKATYITWGVVAILLVLYFVFVFAVSFISASASIY